MYGISRVKTEQFDHIGPSSAATATPSMARARGRVSSADSLTLGTIPTSSQITKEIENPLSIANSSKLRNKIAEEGYIS